MQSRWVFPDPTREPTAQSFARELAVPLFVARFLAGKGFDRAEEADGFLNPRLKTLGDPFELPGMAAAVDRLDVALRRKERVVLYGDYDVDGVASLALLARALREFGGDASCFLPVRADEGYGLSTAGIARCFETFRPQLLIAVDCGTNSVAEVAEAKRRGADVIILDHHEPGGGPLPDCVALVNPKVDGSADYLCSVGLVFKLCHALLKRAPLPGFDLKDYLDFVALGTLADLVPLVEENRVLVRRGLAQMATTRWCGLAALMEVSGVRPPVRGTDVGFRLGPRINAAGRLANAEQALELMLTDDPAVARRLAAKLDEQNRERQAVERSVVREAEEWVAANFDPARHISIVVGARDWHPGVVGIVASRLCRRFHRPSLVVGFNGDGMGKGSGRSINGLSLVEALGRCGSLLAAFGGHEMAAGLSVHEENFEAFRAAFEEAAASMTHPEMLVSRLQLDAEVDLHDLSLSVLDAQDMLEPFGMANSQPVLVARAVSPAGEPRVLKEKHLKLEFIGERRRMSAIFFNGAENALPRPPWDLAFRLERNEFQGNVSPQIQVVAIRSAA